MKKVYFYGIAGAMDNYRVICHSYIDIEQESAGVNRYKREAAWMRYKYCGIDKIYAIDGSAKLARYFMDTVHESTYEKNVDFKNILEEEGMQIIL